MDTRKLGTIEVSSIGIGCMGFSHGYGEIPSEEASIEAIRSAYAFGCTFFDTAESYGPKLLAENRGHNEKLLGKALKEVRGNVVLATKLHLDGEEVKEAGLEATIREHLSQSLSRLQSDDVDLYYLHRVHPDIPVEDVAAVMGKLIRESKIRGWGLSQVDVDTIARAHAVTPLSAIQNIYSLLERGVEERVLPYCMEHNIGFVAFSPIASGFLSGRLSADTDFSHEDDVRKFVPQLRKENMEGNRPILALLEEYAQKKKATKAQLSLSWMLKKYPNVVPIPGSKNKERILENLGAWKVALSDAEFCELEASLAHINVCGHRGFVEQQGSGMRGWGKEDTNKKE